MTAAAAFVNFGRAHNIPDEEIEQELIGGMQLTAEQAAQLMRA